MTTQAGCPDVEKVEKDWWRRGFGCDIWTDPPGSHWDNFSEEFDKLIFVLDGELELEMNGRTSHLKAGDEVLILSGQNHTVRNVGEVPSHRLYGYRRDDAYTD